jgi:hypothetical protein
MSIYNPYYYSSYATAKAAANYYNPYNVFIGAPNPYLTPVSAYNPIAIAAATVNPYTASLYNPYLAISGGYPYWCR